MRERAADRLLTVLFRLAMVDSKRFWTAPSWLRRASTSAKALSTASNGLEVLSVMTILVDSSADKVPAPAVSKVTSYYLPSASWLPYLPLATPLPLRTACTQAPALLRPAFALPHVPAPTAYSTSPSVMASVLQ